MQPITAVISITSTKQSVKYNKHALLKMLAPKHGKVATKK